MGITEICSSCWESTIYNSRCHPYRVHVKVTNYLVLFKQTQYSFDSTIETLKNSSSFSFGNNGTEIMHED